MSLNNIIHSLETGMIPERYKRNMGTIGIDGQLKLLKSKVAVIGAGGLGGNVIELLARQGVGCLRIVDGDVFAEHNLNRQLLSTEGNLGQNKAKAAAARVKAVNSDIIVEALPYMLDEKNSSAVLAGMDVVVDALDNLADRVLLAKAAQLRSIPMVHGAIAGFTGQVATIYPGDQKYENFIKVNSLSTGIETVLGNPATTPAMAAAFQVQEVVKILTGIGEPLQQKILYFDTQFNIFEIVSY